MRRSPGASRQRPADRPLGHPDEARPALPLARARDGGVLARGLARRSATGCRWSGSSSPTTSCAASPTGSAFSTRETPQIRVEDALFGKPVPTVRLQEHFWHGPNHLRWWDYATWFLHLTHFFATFIARRSIWVFAREQFSPLRDDGLRARADGLRDLRALSGGAAVDGRAARQPRRVEPDDRAVWQHIPFTNAGAVFEHGTSYANDVAAMPSLHAAFALLFTLYLWRLVPRCVRPLLALYPARDVARARLLGRALRGRLRRRLGVRRAAFASVNWVFAAPHAARAAVRAGARRLTRAEYPWRRWTPSSSTRSARRSGARTARSRRSAATTSQRRC